jgi:diguanylate cyclase (GGDEF)-like protein/PAS domain S-box-containing protein
VLSSGTASIRRTLAPTAASVNAAPIPQFHYAAIVVLITVGCLAIEILAPEGWRPGVLWLLLAPAAGLAVSGIPALVVAMRTQQRSERAERSAREKDELIGLLLKDYGGDRADWVWSCDVEGKLRGVSQKFAVQAGLSTGALEGRPLAELLVEAEGDGGLGAVAVALRQRQPFYNLEARIMGGGGPCEWLMAGKPVFQDGRFTGYVGTAANITSEFRARQTMSYLAYNDGLTGLANRVHFQKRLTECAARLERYGTAFTLICLDLDKFKAVNDSLGHQAGDRLLIEVARRLASQVRKADLVARLGGDEFALLLPDEANPGNIANLTTRMIQQLCQPFVIDGKELSIGVSVGIAIAPVNGSEPEQLVRNADVALYRAKSEGGDSYCFFEAGMDAAAHEQHALETELEEALDRDELVFHYQPIVAAADREMSGLEALIRWNHPTRGLMLPVDFVPVAERTGLTERVGEWKIVQACRTLAQLPDHLSLAVNVSTGHFRSTDVPAIVARALTQTRVAAHRLEIEVGEDLLLEEADDVAAASLAALKKLGTTIVLDHFGSGYSSLSGLRKFAFDRLKIDGSLVADPREEARKTVKGIMALAGTLDIAVACEGVANAEQAQVLAKAGARLLQGEHFAKPAPLANIALGDGAGPASSKANRRGVATVG